MYSVFKIIFTILAIWEFIGNGWNFNEKSLLFLLMVGVGTIIEEVRSKQ